MPYAIRIEGLAAAQKLLGVRFAPAIKAATLAIALEVQGKVAPYPPATEANSPTHDTGRWYERGYGPKWWVKGAQTSKITGQRMAAHTGGAAFTRRQILAYQRRGIIHGRKTSQLLNRGFTAVPGPNAPPERWGPVPLGRLGWSIGNRATYAAYLHSASKQAKWAGKRGWVTDRTAIMAVIRSGVAKRFVVQALVGAMRRR
ncbi:MAG: hypothetical protein Q7O66_14245 [Dehalococcoidia bacterium]|nr:hypothetical protein [Dehalococcoidia bacterium]